MTLSWAVWFAKSLRTRLHGWAEILCVKGKDRFSIDL